MRDATLPPKHIFELYIAIPASLTLTEHTLLLKTVKVGFIARALAIYRVNGIIVYIDRNEALKELPLIRDILEYLTIPPYLRKKLVPLKDTLKYAGILPPLKTPNHPRSKGVSDGEIREGLVVSVKRDVALVDIGLGKPVKLRNHKVKVGQRVIVKIHKKNDEVYCTLTKPDGYWCYTVHTVKSLRDVLKFRKWGLKIATSKYGTSIVKVKDELRDKLLESKSVLVAFGSPFEGLWEIAKRENISLDREFHYILNTIPNQGTETVRTEEALYATLGVLSIIEAENL